MLYWDMNGSSHDCTPIGPDGVSYNLYIDYMKFLSDELYRKIGRNVTITHDCDPILRDCVQLQSKVKVDV